MNDNEARTIVAAATAETRGEDHAPHPATCLRRLLDACFLLHRQGPDGVDRQEIVIRLGVESGHLAVLQELGLMAPVWDLFGFVRWTPEQTEQLRHASAKWMAQRRQGAS